MTTAKQAGTNEERRANRTRSSTSLTVLVRPVESLSFPFDSSTEDLFDAVIARSFPEVARRWNDKQAERQEKRGGDWHGIEFWQNNLDFEMNWLFSPREVALVTQVNIPVSGFGSCWSLADVALNISFLLCAANCRQYYSEGEKLANAIVTKVRLQWDQKAAETGTGEVPGDDVDQADN